MKRPAKIIKVSVILPLFTWRRCMVCGFEFRREWGWLLRCPRRVYYLCLDCAPTEDEAREVCLRRHGV